MQSQLIGNPCTISQEAALATCSWDAREEIARRVKAFDERRRYLLEHINRIDGLKLAAPKGAFYALVDARGLCQRLRCTDEQLAERLLDEALLAVMPGSAFAIPGFIRLSYAAAMKDLERAVERLRAFVAK
jgi:aspartate aminotransferase